MKLATPFFYRRVLVFILAFFVFASAHAETWTDKSHDVFSTDYNHDGREDLVLKGAPNAVKIPYDIEVDLKSRYSSFVLLQNADGSYSTVTLSNASSLDGMTLQASDYQTITGDFNGDGEPDFLLKSPTKDDLVLQSRDSGDSLAYKQRLTSNDVPGSARVSIADVDGDGSDDLLVFGETEQKVLQAANDGTFSRLQTGGGNGVAVTSGNASVSGDGSSGYQVGLVLPPGVGGLTPDLSLTYSSNAGIGHMGVGWNLGGFQSISRCKPIYPTEGTAKAAPMSNEERFCLNGSKLIAVSGAYGANGTEYRTEVDQFVKVKSYGREGAGPGYFKAWTKSGLILEFGNSASSKVRPSGTSTISSWSLNKSSDLFDNEFAVVYDVHRATGEHYPDYIQYSPDVRVDFQYEDRGGLDGQKDVLWRFKAGKEYSVTKRLKNITTSVDGQLVRRYDVFYKHSPSTGRSRVKTITECAYGDNGSSATCAEPITLTWQEGTEGYESSSVSLISMEREPGRNPMMFDANGDGYLDLIWAKNYRWWVAEGSSDGFGEPIRTGISEGAEPEFAVTAQPIKTGKDGAYGILVVTQGTDDNTILTGGGDSIYFYVWSVLSFHKNQYSNTYSQRGAQIIFSLGAKPIVGDFNGDGRDDVFGFLEDDIVKGLNYYYDNNDVWHDESKPGVPEKAKNAFVALRTDSFFDLKNIGYYVHFADNIADGYTEASGYSLANSFSADIDGNGLDDIVAKNGSSWYQISPKPTSEIVTDANGGKHQVYAFDKSSIGIPTGDGADGNGTMSDLNQDGLPDMLVRVSNQWRAYINKGNGFTSYPTGVSTFEADPTVIPLNYDSDGNNDFLFKTNSGWDLYSTYIERDHVTLHKEQAFSVNGAFSGNERPFIADVNGDGLGDIFFSDNESWKAYLHRQGKADLLTKVVDGAGIETQFHYEPISNPDVHTYQKHTCRDNNEEVCFPYSDVRSGIFVVDEMKSSNGVGGVGRLTYEYTGAMAHEQGRGFSGFSEQTITDHQLGTTYQRSFLQEFPFTGRIKSIVAKKGSETIAKETFDWRSRQPYAGKPIALTYIADSTKEVYDSSLISASKTTFTVDNYGNKTSQSRVTGTSISLGTISGIESNVTVSRQFRPAEVSGDNWRIGFLQSETISAGGQSTTTTQAPWNGTMAVASRTENAGTDRWQTTSLQYDSHGNTTSTTVSAADASTRRVEKLSNWDRNLLPQSIENAAGHVQTLRYGHRYGQVTQATDANGLASTARYDNWGRLIYQQEPDGTETRIVRNWCADSCPQGALIRVSRLVTNAQADGLAQPPSTTYLDRFGRALRQSSKNLDGRTVYADTRYDTLGRVTSASLPYYPGSTPKWTEYKEYDVFGRPHSVEHPDGSSVTYSFGSGSNYSRKESITTETIKPDGSSVRSTVKRQFNSAGLLKEVSKTGGPNTDYTYDGFGRLKTTTVGGESSTTITIGYDAGGNQRYLDDPDLGRVDFTFDGLGQLRSQTDAKDQQTSFEYDILGRLKNRTTGYQGVGNDKITQAQSWIYDTAENGVGRLARVEGPDYLKTYQYDDLSRVNQMSTKLFDQSAAVFKYGYDAFSRPRTITYPSGFAVASQYNKLGYRVGMSSPTNESEYWSATKTDVFGQIVEEHFGNGVKTRRSYNDVNGFLEGIKTTRADATFQNHGYTYDTKGNLYSRSAVIQGKTTLESFEYDGLDRLTKATTTGLPDGNSRLLSFRYDKLGNITYKNGTSDYNGYHYGGSRPHAVTKVTLDGEDTEYAYDANGNVIQAGNRSLLYNSFNKPVRIAEGGRVSTFRYGPSGARFYQAHRVDGNLKRQTYYVAGGKYEKIVDVDKGEVKEKSYVGGILLNIKSHPLVGGRTQQKLHYLHKDVLGSTDVITNALGDKVEDLAYEPFGERRNADWTTLEDALALTSPKKTSRGYTGHEHLDEFNLIHMNGRVYDPVIGRFLSPDPLVQAPTFSQSYNRYSYVWNNPMSNTDPSGYSGSSLSGDMVDTYIEDGAIIVVPRAGGSSGLRSGSNDINTNIAFGAPSTHVSSARDLQSQIDLGHGYNNALSTNSGVSVGYGGGHLSVSSANSDVGSSVTIRNASSGMSAGGSFAKSPSRGRSNWRPKPAKPSAADASQLQGAAGTRVSTGNSSGLSSFFSGLSVFDAAHFALDILATSEIPIVSQVAGVASAAAYAVKGDLVGAGSALGGLLPGAGAFADGARVAAWGAKFAGSGLIAAKAARVSRKVTNRADTLRPGPFAKRSIPARGPNRDFTKAERHQINKIGKTDGCHTCGTKNPGTKSGDFIPDHQTPNKLNTNNDPQILLPHCKACSLRQGGQVRQATRK